ncbi:MATE family efflux transporter [Paraclostridium bifermentans]|uniref:MATE family efflux transporter n=1 Tax=Paraclostridium bifermentans TaxID=1490 RepID=UPI00359CB05E
MEQNILGTEKISKLFIKFSMPAVISMVIAGAQTMIDGMFVGNFVGPNALASINIVQPFMQLIIGSTMIICIGCISFIGRKLGEGKIKEAQDIFRTAFICTFIVSTLILILGVCFSKEIADILGANEVLLEGVSTYTKSIALFAPIMSLMYLFGFTDRLIGKPELYLKGMILSVIINVSLDFIFVKELQLGIQGAAYATGLAYVGGLIIVSVPMLNKKNIVNLFKGNFDKKVIIPMVYNGSSEGVTSIATATTAYIFNITFMNIAGEAGVAAFTTINYIGQFGTLVMFGISDGIGPIISYNYGDENYERLNNTLKLALKVNLIVGVILFITLYLFGRELISLFARENVDIVNLAVSGSRIYAFSFILNGFNIINSGYFTSIGKAKESIVIAASRGIVFIISGIIILPMLIGINGVWLTVPFAECITLVIGMYMLKRNNEEFENKLVKQEI